MNSMENILDVKNLSRQFDEFALEGVSFALQKGHIMGFVGENGAGKTTTIKLILNAIRKDSGDVTVFGLDHIRKEKEVKKQLGVVLDENYFHEMMTPKDIRLIMKNVYSNWDDEIYQQYLKRFNLPEKRTLKEFSKGMKTKLSIAVALSHKPKLLILDEPTSGLDPVSRNDILDIFRKFVENGQCSILFSTHITSDLEKIADYVTFISHGKIMLSKTIDEIADEYGVLRCGVEDFDLIDKKDIIGWYRSGFGFDMLVENKKQLQKKYRDMTIDKATIEDILLYYTKGGEEQW